jgi:glycosyltransferase involved in cell wall biosynthesis
VYVCSSDTEGLSNVLLEASATALPIIATRVGGNPEIVVDGDNGLLVAARRPDFIVDAALLLAANSRLRKEMGVRGRDRAQKYFSIQAMVKAHEDLYAALCRVPTEISTLHAVAAKGNYQ